MSETSRTRTGNRDIFPVDGAGIRFPPSRPTTPSSSSGPGESRRRSPRSSTARTGDQALRHPAAGSRRGRGRRGGHLPGGVPRAGGLRPVTAQRSPVVVRHRDQPDQAAQARRGAAAARSRTDRRRSGDRPVHRTQRRAAERRCRTAGGRRPPCEAARGPQGRAAAGDVGRPDLRGGRPGDGHPGGHGPLARQPGQEQGAQGTRRSRPTSVSEEPFHEFDDPVEPAALGSARPDPMDCATRRKAAVGDRRFGTLPPLVRPRVRPAGRTACRTARWACGGFSG